MPPPGSAPLMNAGAKGRNEVARRTARCRSQSAWSRIQNCGEVFRSRDNRRAVSAVMRRLPRTTSLRRFAETPSRCAASACRSPSGSRNSSSNISPGGIAAPGQSGSLVTVFDSNLAGRAVLPPKRDAILLVDPYAVLLGPRPLQPFRAIAGRDAEVVEPSRHVEGLQLPLRDAPHANTLHSATVRLHFCGPSAAGDHGAVSLPHRRPARRSRG